MSEETCLMFVNDDADGDVGAFDDAYVFHHISLLLPID